MYVCPRMSYRLLLSILVLVLAALFWTSVPSGCANIMPPAGGPRDSLPPVLLKAEPGDSTTNFRGREVVFSFDEYIDLKDLSNNVIWTPTFDVNPAIEVRGRTITIKFKGKDTLVPNTTYVVNFGNAIVDINESNVLKDYTYAFSTGPFLDSLEITGQVILAETGTIDSSMLVVLHRDFRDSAVRTERPPYAVRLNNDGRFRFRYLPSDTFAIYAIGEPTFSKRYQSKDQLFAFADSPVIAGQTDSLVLYAYREVPKTTPQSAGQGPRISPLDRRLRFTPKTTGQQDLLSDYIIEFPVPLKNVDSTKISLATDSTFTPANFSTELDTTGKLLTVKSAWKENTRYFLLLQQDFASDTNGRQLLKTDTLTFVTRKLADYGSLLIRMKNLDTTRNPVILLILNNEVVQSAPIKSGVFSKPLFLPGEYQVRILYDTNGNGKWDPGQFFGNRRQPELVVPVTGRITIKPNWENEFDL